MDQLLEMKAFYSWIWLWIYLSNRSKRYWFCNCPQCKYVCVSELGTTLTQVRNREGKGFSSRVHRLLRYIFNYIQKYSPPAVKAVRSQRWPTLFSASSGEEVFVMHRVFILQKQSTLHVDMLERKPAAVLMGIKNVWCDPNITLWNSQTVNNTTLCKK